MEHVETVAPEMLPMCLSEAAEKLLGDVIEHEGYVSFVTFLEA